MHGSINKLPYSILKKEKKDCLFLYSVGSSAKSVENHITTGSKELLSQKSISDVDYNAPYVLNIYFYVST